MEIPYFATHERPRCRADPGRSARAGERSGARPRDGDADGPAERPFRHGAGRRLRPAEGSRRFGRTTAAPPRRSTGGLGRGSAGAGRFHERSFLPGRGLLDMKSGIAAGIAVVEAFAADPARRGNLLFAATPDEEDRSVGMRAAAELLLFFSGSAASSSARASISMRSATTGMVRRAASSPSAASASSC